MTSHLLDLIRAVAYHVPMNGPVLEIGSYIEDHQDHLDLRQAFPPGTSYIGVDVLGGRGVDRRIDLFDEQMIILTREFLPKTILCLYVIEHVWHIVRAAQILSDIRKHNCESWLWVSTHQNQPFHGTEKYPDYWRITAIGMKRLFEEADVKGVHVLVYPDSSNPEDVVAVRQPASMIWPVEVFSKILGATPGSPRVVRDHWEEV